MHQCHQIPPPLENKPIVHGFVFLPVSITEQMATIRKRSETSVIGHIGDDLLAWVRPIDHQSILSPDVLLCKYDENNAGALVKIIQQLPPLSTLNDTSHHVR